MATEARVARSHPAPAEQFDDPLITAQHTGAALRVVDREELGGRLAYRVDVTQLDGTVGSYYVDTETLLLVRAAEPSMRPGIDRAQEQAARSTRLRAT